MVTVERARRQSRSQQLDVLVPTLADLRSWPLYRAEREARRLLREGTEAEIQALLAEIAQDAAWRPEPVDGLRTDEIAQPGGRRA